MGILEGIWTFLNTPVGQTIVVSVLGWFGVDAGGAPMPEEAVPNPLTLAEAAAAAGISESVLTNALEAIANAAIAKGYTP